MTIVKTDLKNYVKDTRTGMITNTSTGYKEFKLQKERSKKIIDNQIELEQTKKTLKDVQSDLNDIKEMLNKVLENGKNGK